MEMKRFQWVLLFAILVVAVNLRPAVASISPVLELIREDLGLSYTTVSLLTTIPTLCMGVFALTIPVITDRIGRERGVFLGAILIAVATGARLWGHHFLVLFGSTFLVGVGIAVTQALLPPLVIKYFRDRESFATGLYTASLTIGAALAGGFTSPINNFVGSWSVSLAAWAIPAVIAVPIWYISWRWMAQQREGDETMEGDRAHLPWRNRWAIVLTLFFGGVATVFFSVLTWLAPRYVALGWSSSQAGILLSVFVFTQLGGNLIMSAFGDRVGDQRPLAAFHLSLVIGGAAGIAIAPQTLPWIWALALGIGAGGMFSFVLTLPVTYASGPKATDGLSSMTLGGGYLIAAIGPFVAGLLRDLTGSYAVTFGGLVLLGVILLGVSIRFKPDRETITAQTHEPTVGGQ